MQSAQLLKIKAKMPSVWDKGCMLMLNNCAGVI